MDMTAWHELIQSEAEPWSQRLAEIDELVREALFNETDGLNKDLVILSAYFYTTYLNHYVESLVTDVRANIPTELLAQYAAIAEELAETAIKSTVGNGLDGDPELLDPEDRITMKGGDA